MIKFLHPFTKYYIYITDMLKARESQGQVLDSLKESPIQKECDALKQVILSNRKKHNVRRSLLRDHTLSGAVLPQHVAGRGA